MSESVNEPACGIRLDRAGPVATMRLGRSGAVDPCGADPLTLVHRLGRELPGDVRVVVVDADTFACPPDGDSGHVLGDMARGDPAVAGHRVGVLHEAAGWFRRPDLVSVAVIRGRVAGVGLALILACDLRIIASDGQIAFDTGATGGIPCLGGTQRLVELVGYPRALELCLTGRVVCADQAAALGLANTVVPSADLDSAVSTLVDGVLAMRRDLVVELKALLGQAMVHTRGQQEMAERAAAMRCAADLVRPPSDRSDEAQ